MLFLVGWELALILPPEATCRKNDTPRGIDPSDTSAKTSSGEDVLSFFKTQGDKIQAKPKRWGDLGEQVEVTLRIGDHHPGGGQEGAGYDRQHGWAVYTRPDSAEKA